MRIRLHKSRTTSTLLVMSLLLVGAAASGAAIKALSKNSSSEQSLTASTSSTAQNDNQPSNSPSTGVGNGGNPGNSCKGRSQVDNSLKQGEKSNGQSADCGAGDDEDNNTGGGGNFVGTQSITITAEDQSVPYSGKEHDVVYSVQPAAAVCTVKYNGLSAKPIDKGMWDSRISCELSQFAPAEKSVILTITDEVKQAAPKVEPSKKPTIKRFTPIKVPFTLSSSKMNSKSMAKIKKMGSKPAITSVTVYGYAQPSGNKAADMKLSRERAQQVAKQIKAIAPSLKVKIVARGSRINSECMLEKNKCVLIK